jgi:hypothetical protein
MSSRNEPTENQGETPLVLGTHRYFTPSRGESDRVCCMKLLNAFDEGNFDLVIRWVLMYQQYLQLRLDHDDGFAQRAPPIVEHIRHAFAKERVASVRVHLEALLAACPAHPESQSH